MYLNPPNIIANELFNTTQAVAYQKAWSHLIIKQDSFTAIDTVAGIDLAYDYKTNRTFAAAVLLDAHSLAVLEVQKASRQTEVPYRSGFLSFREVPALADVINKLSVKPGLLICDGQGIAHPRRFGLACHLGLLFDIPAIGCGKSRLYGTAQSPGLERGDINYMYNQKKEIIGCVLRTRNKVRPVYISIGHKISLSTACKWILHLTPKYRLPETTRLADRFAREYKVHHLITATDA